MKQINNEIFARKTETGNYVILYSDTGEFVTRIDANIYPIGSNVSTRYEHPKGIYLTKEQVIEFGIEFE